MCVLDVVILPQPPGDPYILQAIFLFFKLFNSNQMLQMPQHVSALSDAYCRGLGSCFFCRTGRNKCAELQSSFLLGTKEALGSQIYNQSRVESQKEKRIKQTRLNQCSPSIRLQFLQCGLNWTVATWVMMWRPKHGSGVIAKTRNPDTRALEPEQDRGLCWIKCWNYYKQLCGNC